MPDSSSSFYYSLSRLDVHLKVTFTKPIVYLYESLLLSSCKFYSSLSFGTSRKMLEIFPILYVNGMRKAIDPKALEVLQQLSQMLHQSTLPKDETANFQPRLKKKRNILIYIFNQKIKNSL